MIAWPRLRFRLRIWIYLNSCVTVIFFLKGHLSSKNMLFFLQRDTMERHVWTKVFTPFSSRRVPLLQVAINKRLFLFFKTVKMFSLSAYIFSHKQHCRSTEFVWSCNCSCVCWSYWSLRYHYLFNRLIRLVMGETNLQPWVLWGG